MNSVLLGVGKGSLLTQVVVRTGSTVQQSSVVFRVRGRNCSVKKIKMNKIIYFCTFGTVHIS